MTPRLRSVLVVLVAGVGFGAGTVLAGWWALPVLAALLALVRLPAWQAASAALLAWMALLLRNAAAAPLLPYADRLGGLFGFPGFAILLMTLLFAALLAWSAAAVVDSLKPGGR